MASKGRYWHTRLLLVCNCALGMAQNPYKLALHLIITLVALLSSDLLPAILWPMVKAHGPHTHICWLHREYFHDDVLYWFTDDLHIPSYIGIQHSSIPTTEYCSSGKLESHMLGLESRVIVVVLAGDISQGVDPAFPVYIQGPAKKPIPILLQEYKILSHSYGSNISFHGISKPRNTLPFTYQSSGPHFAEMRQWLNSVILGGVTASVNPDQCAIGPDGQLKDSADIEWFNDADDSAPVAGPSSKDSDLHYILGRGGCKQKTEQLNESLTAQKLNDDGKVKVTRKAHVKGPGKGKAKATIVDSSDEDDACRIPGIKDDTININCERFQEAEMSPYEMSRVQ
ncbi:hypothetical protein EDD85DRAFT_789575 [Armillaria nabsnona]|nr:hypothetical protein EDD85DRAFT_789575 [Armillaria nabsnona]